MALKSGLHPTHLLCLKDSSPWQAVVWVCKRHVLPKLQILCRYHSHPVFAPQPSQKDCESQRNYQVLFRCGETGLEPFLGVIIGPYHLQLPTPVRRFPATSLQRHQGAS